MIVPRFSDRRTPLLAAMVLLLAMGCASSEDQAIRVLADSIDRYGGEAFDDSYIRFTFRGVPFEVLRENGGFRYQRAVTDSMGRPVTEVMENSGTWIERDGARIELDSTETYQVETAVNSVVYFGFLPFRLDDPSVLTEYLGEVEVEGEPYHEIRVTFPREGGGVDWDTEFVYWIHADALTVDFLVYRYSRDGGGTRFRRAVNRREIGGLLVQDYENYAAPEDPEDLAEYDRLYEEGGLELLSMIELEDVVVRRASAVDDDEASTAPGDPSARDQAAAAPVPGGAADGLGSDPVPAELEGLETIVGIDQASYAPGDPIRVVIGVVNRAPTTKTLEFPSSMRYDLVLRQQGEERFRWSEGRAFAQALGEVTLEPGQSVEFEESILAPNVPGGYELQALVASRPQGLEVVLPVRVEE